jgi:hypothetical protein
MIVFKRVNLICQAVLNTAHHITPTRFPLN